MVNQESKTKDGGGGGGGEGGRGEEGGERFTKNPRPRIEERITQFLAADKSLSPSGTFLNKSAD